MERIERTCHDSLDDLVAVAIAAGATPALAEEARRVTSAQFRFRGSAAVVSDRARAYFWGVVRRRVLRGAAPELARALVVSSLEHDLAEAGYPPDAISREVARLRGIPWAAPLDGMPGRAA